ncbi:MAG: HRDC domain-containing protein [Bacteroidetes bacterium]|nr:HRDC domain-containing protein [Bacteroidota bacterium]
MQFKIYTIPLLDDGQIVEEMNRFLRGNKVVNVDKQLVTLNGGGAYWSFCVQYIGNAVMTNKEEFERKGKIDYKNELSEATFAVFSRLRACRKKIADDEAIPAYAVFTDAELAEIARLDEITEKNMLSIHGIGSKKMEKYGKQMCQMILENNAVTNDKVEGS